MRIKRNEGLHGALPNLKNKKPERFYPVGLDTLISRLYEM